MGQNNFIVLSEEWYIIGTFMLLFSIFIQVLFQTVINCMQMFYIVIQITKIWTKLSSKYVCRVSGNEMKYYLIKT